MARPLSFLRLHGPFIRSSPCLLHLQLGALAVLSPSHCPMFSSSFLLFFLFWGMLTMEFSINLAVFTVRQTRLKHSNPSRFLTNAHWQQSVYPSELQHFFLLVPYSTVGLSGSEPRLVLQTLTWRPLLMPASLIRGAPHKAQSVGPLHMT